MNSIFAILIFTLIFNLAPAFASGSSSRSESSSGGAKVHNLKSPWSELSGGVTSLTQTLDNTHVEHPLGFKASAHEKFGPFHFGISALGAIHGETQQPGTYSQVNINESLYLETINAGVIIGDFLILDGGYGYAQMRRSVSNPFGSPSSTVNTTATGTGYMVGGTVLPVRTKVVSVGVSYYYFEATGTSYDQDSVTGSTQTKSTTPGKVKSNGSLSALTLLFNY